MHLTQKYMPSTLDDLLFDDNIISILKSMYSIQYFNLFLCGSDDCGKSTLINTIINQGITDNIIESKNIHRLNNCYINTFVDYLNKMKIFCNASSSNKLKLVIIENLENYSENNQQQLKTVIQNSKENVFFIITSNNITNVIETIQSCLFQIHIERQNQQKVTSFIEHVAKCEHMTFSKSYLHMMCDKYDYKLIEIMSCLERIKLGCKSQLDNHEVSNVTVEKFLNFCRSGNIHGAYLILHNYYNVGYAVIDIIDDIYQYLKRNEKNFKLIEYICTYINFINEGNDNIVQLYFFTVDVSQQLCK